MHHKLIDKNNFDKIITLEHACNFLSNPSFQTKWLYVVDTTFSNSSYNNNYGIIKYFVPASVMTINPYGRVVIC